MATENTTPQNITENQAVGKALLVSGQVQAQSPDGALRPVEANGTIFANDRIITGTDGRISIVFGDSGQSRLDLGRMSDVIIDEDVFQADAPVDLNEVTAEVERIQQALLDENFDPTEGLPAPAAGPAAAAVAGAGGSIDYVKFELTGAEVTPVSGAETIGISRNFLDPEQITLEPVDEIPIAPAVATAPLAAPAPAPAAAPPPADIPPIIPPPPPDFTPIAGDVVRVIDEENFADGTNPDTALLTTSGTLADLGVSFPGDLPGSLDFGGGNSIVLDGAGGDFIDIPGLYGTLRVNDDGTWSYTLNDNIVHPDSDPGDGDGTTGADDSLPELFPFLAVDDDGDSAPGSITINIYDDGPEATGTVIDRVLEEEALDNYLAGNPDVVGSDGNADENDGPEDASQPDAAVVNGSFASLVNVGADNPGTFKLVSIDGLPPLLSQGGSISYVINGDTIEAWVYGKGEEFPNGQTSSELQFEDFSPDRLVFTLQVLPNGNYTFTLLDQLDHLAPPEGSTADENFGLISGTGSVDSIDFSTAIQVTDTDGDSIGFAPGTLTFTVVDDIPVAREEFRGIEAIALEDGLSQDSGDAGDLSDGNRENGESTNDDEDYGYSGSLSGIFHVGSDETGTSEGPMATYGITTDSSILSTLDTLFSKGEQLYYSSDGSTLTANTAADGSGRTAFTLSVNPDGSWKFDLDDQLDHVDDGSNDENWALQGSKAEGGAFDVSSILTITDYDGDTATGAAAGAFVIKVQDDVPLVENTGTSFFVSEYAGFNNVIGTYELDESGNPVNAQILVNSSNTAVGGGMGENEQQLGVYEAGTKFFLIANGANALGDLSGASLNFVANAGTGPDWLLEINGSTAYSAPVYYMDVALNADGKEHFKDENGNFLNAVPAEGGEIRIEDLSLGDADYDDTVLRVEMGPVVDEANLPDGTDPDAGSLTVYGNLFTGAGGVKLQTGADEKGTLTVASEKITLNNDGATGSSQSLVLDGSGDFIEVLSDAGKLVVNDDGSWSYTLMNNTLVHPDNDPGGNDNTDGDSDRGSGDQVQDIFGLTFTDADGDEVTPQIVININDDGPEANKDTDGVQAAVEEDDMALADGDNSQGINEDGSDNADEASGGPGSLAVLFNIGADNDTVTYGLNSDFSSIGGLKSHGEALGYTITGDTLTASTSYGQVFTLQVKADGSWNFDLKDQLDHVADGNTEGNTLVGSTAPGGGIDFSSVVIATDADGDTAYGAVDNSFVINVQDDVPELVDEFDPVLVFEDGLASALGDASDGIGGGDTSATIDLHALLKSGADEPLTFSLAAPEPGYSTGLTSKEQAVTYSVTDNKLTASAGGNPVFTFALDVATGIATFDLVDQLDHTGGGDGEILTISDLGKFINATDTDGDSINLGQLLEIQVENDVPETLGTSAGFAVYEDGLDASLGDFSDGIGGGATDDGFNLSSLVASGADEEISYSLVGPPAGYSTGLYSKGHAVTYAVSSSGDIHTLTATANGGTVFTFTVDGTSGAATFDLVDQLDHQDINDQGIGDSGTLNISDLGTFVRATDADGDFVSFDGLINVTVENDVPEIGNPQDSILSLEQGNSLTASLDITGSGADEPASLTILLTEGAAVTTTALSGGKQMTSDGQGLFWHQNSDGSWSAVTKHDSGDLDPDAKAFTVSVDIATGTYTVLQNGQIDGGATVTKIDFANALNGGNTNQAVFGSGGTENTTGNTTTYTGGVYVWATASKDLADAFGWDGNSDSWDSRIVETVNYAAQGVGVGGGAMVGGDSGGDDGATRNSEILSFKFFSSLTVDESGNSQNAVQVNVNQSTALDLSAVTLVLDHLGTAETAYYTLWNDGKQVSGQFEASNLVGGSGGSSTSANDFSLHIDSSQLNTGETVFDEIRLEASDDSEYRIQSAEVEVYKEGFDQTIEIPFELTDADNDTVIDDFSVTFDGNDIIDAESADALDGDESTEGMVIAGSSRAEDISGSEYDDTINGGGGDDTIRGNDGDDTIDGGAGNDTIGGNAGNDTLDGGEDNDAVYGGEGDDTVDGGPGDDIVDGGEETSDPVEGNDTVSGGEGADTMDTAEETAGEVTDYEPEPPPAGDEDELDNLVPPPEVG